MLNHFKKINAFSQKVTEEQIEMSKRFNEKKSDIQRNISKNQKSMEESRKSFYKKYGNFF